MWYPGRKFSVAESRKHRKQGSYQERDDGCWSSYVLGHCTSHKVHGTSQHPAHTQDHQVLDVQKSHGSLRLIYGFRRLLADELLTKLANKLKQHPRRSWGGYSVLRKEDRKPLRMSIHSWHWGSNSMEYGSDGEQVVKGHIGQAHHLWDLVSAFIEKTSNLSQSCWKVCLKRSEMEWIVSPNVPLWRVNCFELKLIKTH